MAANAELHISHSGSGERFPLHGDMLGTTRRESPDRRFVIRAELRIEQERIGVRIRMDISKQLFPETIDRDQSESRVFRLVGERLPVVWGKRDHIQLIGGECLWVDYVPNEGIAGSRDLCVPILLSGPCVADIHLQHGPLVVANRKYKSAVDALREIITNGMSAMQAQRQQVFSLLRFIEASLHAGDVGHLYSWYEEKMSRIRRGIDELMARKNPNHPTALRYINEIASPLYHFQDIDIWDVTPPSSQMVDQYLPSV